MILTVDIGNTRVKWALWMVGAITDRGVITYGAYKEKEVFTQLFADLKKPEKVFAVCVAGDEIRQLLADWVLQNWKLDVDFLKTQKKYKQITHAYKNPEQHGVDRWAAVIAGHYMFPDSAVCVICAGTALTFDLINKEGRHLGGYILPSYVTSHKTLISGTANIDSAPDELGYSEISGGEQLLKQDLPDNTADAVNLGLHIMLQAGIREICQLARKKVGDPMRIIISGGGAKSILNYQDVPSMEYKPDLIMQGLYIIKMQLET